ncbi:hypothetical protein OG613_48585 (plasmid) [Streptomyces sp. NBC_00015]|uniref:hypothetical protein n=1 Tax=Streptomyces sp. NBC_00015 TaxID=2903611 RepID=UPI00324DF5D5
MPKKKQKKRSGRQGHRPVAQRELVPQPRMSAPAENLRPDDDLIWEADPPPEFSSGGAAVDLKFATGTIPSVRLGFGELFAQERRRPIREGWGYTVELPAVLELLERIGDGRITPEDAHSVLFKSADLLYDTLRCWESEDPDELRNACREAGGCVLCEQRRPRLDAWLDQADDRWQRLQQPEAYPFAAGRQGLHVTLCSVVTREMPSEYARPTGEDYVAALNAFSHADDPYFGEDFEGSRSYPRFDVMTPGEARAWIAERTGPKGGRNYKRCQRCAPAL